MSPFKQESKGIAVPGYAGFVGSLKYQFGQTYGNATKELNAERVQKQASMQSRRDRKAVAAHSKVPATTSSTTTTSQVKEGGRDTDAWKKPGKFTTGDDRFSFPPVPGYTGYIPRSQEHFGKSYVELTNASLNNFQSMLAVKNKLPARIAAIRADQHNKNLQAKATPSSAAHKATFTYSATISPIDVASPYKLPSGHENKTFISGYTGFVPRSGNQFGQTYSKTVRSALDDFTHAKVPTSPYDFTRVAERKDKLMIHSQPIPGFTGFIPGRSSSFASTFGKSSETAYASFNHRDDKGRVPTSKESQMPIKRLAETLPIPGYKGHIPNYALNAEKSYGISSRDCIRAFEQLRAGGSPSSSSSS